MRDRAYRTTSGLKGVIGHRVFIDARHGMVLRSSVAIEMAKEKATEYHKKKLEAEHLETVK